MRNLKVRRLIAMIMTVITVGAQSPLTAFASELTDDITVAETAADEEETSKEAAEPQVSNNEADNSADTEETAPADDAAVEEVIAAPDETETESVTEGFALTEADFAAKKALRDHNVVEQFASLTEGVDYASNEVFFTADTEEYAEAVAEAYGAKLKSYSFGVAVLDLTDSQLSVGQAYAMGADENVLLPVVEPNYIVTLDDPEIDKEAEAKKKNNLLESKITQWDDFGRYDPLLNPSDPNFQWWHQYIDTYGAWGLFASGYRPNIGRDIKVAVIDSGVTASHEELAGHTEAKDIGLGTVDGNGHGTHVAGIIGASIDNYSGGSGIAPGVQILGYRASDDNGRFMGSDTVKAINAAVADGANIINMSLGGPVFTAAEDTALQAAYTAGVTIVAAAGNEAKNGYSYPAAYDHVIAVGASEESGNKTTFSNYGSWVDVMAPGANMRSTYPGSSNDTYCNMQGTSQACPVVAGVCALYMSACGVTSPDEMEQIIKRSTTPCKTKGASATGIINAAKMFDGDATAPQIDVYAEDDKTVVATAESGGFGTCSTVKGSQYIEFTGKGFNGDEEGNANTTYYVTVDGSNPNPHDSASSIRYTTAYKTFRVSSSGRAHARVNVGSLLRAYYRENVAETTFTVKAVAVTGRGVISAVTSMQVTVDPEPYYNVDAYGGVGTFAQGTSMQLYASVYANSRWSYSSTTSGVDQGVKWSIASNSGCSGTSISDTGMLTIGASDAGYFSVKCESTAYPNATPAELYFNVARRAPVASVEVDQETLTQLANEIVIREWGEVTPEIKLNMTLTDGTVINSDLPAVSWSSSDWWIASGTVKEGKNVVYPRSNGNCTLTGTVMDGSNTQFTVNVKIKSLIYYFDMTGQSEIAQGKSAKFKAVPLSHTQYELLHGDYKYDSGASKMAKKYGPGDKSFTWSIKDYNGNADTQISGVTVKNGKVKVASSVPAGTTFSVAVTAVAGTEKTSMAFYPVKVTGASNELLITTEATDPAYNIKVSKKGSVTTVQLFIMDVSTSNVDESAITLKATTTNGSRVYWKRSNYNTGWDYLYNYSDDGSYTYDPNTIRIYSYGYKTETTYTAEVRDGTKKKAKVKVKVIVPVASMQITANGLGTYANMAKGADMLVPESGITKTYMASGCSTKLSVAFGDEYGTATNKKVKWEGKAGYMVDGVFTEDASLAGMFKLKNGNLKFNKAFTTDLTMNKGVLITATAMDGTQLKAQKFVVATKRTTYLKFVKAQTGGLLIFETDGTAMEFDIQTDNPNIACPEFYNAGKSENGNILVAFAIYSPKGNLGNVTFTITAKDGTNTKFKQTFNLR